VATAGFGSLGVESGRRPWQHHPLFGDVVGMKWKLWASVVLASMVVSSSMVLASDQTPPLCLAGMRAALVHGHFTGPIVCSRKNATFVLVGRTAGDKFSIYDYRYRYLPAGGNVMHGGQKLMVFRDRSYLGQYALSPPPYIIVAVKDTHVSLRASGASRGVTLDFSREPPSRILVGGEMETFIR
jgi:hypothetical protein